MDFSLQWLLLLWSTGSRHVGSVVVARRLLSAGSEHTGLVAPQHVGSSRTRARTRVPSIGRRILNHCATREVPQYIIWLIIFYLLSSLILKQYLSEISYFDECLLVAVSYIISTKNHMRSNKCLPNSNLVILVVVKRPVLEYVPKFQNIQKKSAQPCNTNMHLIQSFFFFSCFYKEIDFCHSDLALF